MRKGITVYPGLGNSAINNIQLIERAVQSGVTRLMLSLALPYADVNLASFEIGRVLKTARRHQLDVVAAATPEILRMLHLKHLSFRSLRIMGIRTLYMKEFNAKELARFSHNDQHIHIQFNAAAVTEENIEQLLANHPNLQRLEAIHGRYPRKGTGLSEENLVKKTVLLHKFGVSVSAFIPGSRRILPPLCDGQPSLESHRSMSADLACRHLAAIGIDSVFIGDSFPTDAELDALGSVKRWEISLRINLYTHDAIQIKLLHNIYTARYDEARDAVRAYEGESVAKKLGSNIAPENTVPRKFGDITIDNDGCPEFTGELQIIKRSSPASHFTNVAADVHEEEQFLINYIIPGRHFRFLFDVVMFFVVGNAA